MVILFGYVAMFVHRRNISCAREQRKTNEEEEYNNNKKMILDEDGNIK